MNAWYHSPASRTIMTTKHISIMQCFGTLILTELSSVERSTIAFSLLSFDHVRSFQIRFEYFHILLSHQNRYCFSRFRSSGVSDWFIYCSEWKRKQKVQWNHDFIHDQMGIYSNPITLDGFRICTKVSFTNCLRISCFSFPLMEFGQCFSNFSQIISM